MNKLRRTISITLMITILSFLLTGCWDRREIEMRSSVVAISIDRAKKPSKEGEPMFLVSIQIPIPVRIAGGSGGKGGGGGGKEAVRVMSATGFTVANAFNNIQKRLNQQLFFGHTRVIAISEELAREGVEEILDGFRRDPQLRRLLWFLVVEGEAVELLRSDPKLEQIPTVYIMSLIENGIKTERLPDTALGNFYISLSNKSLQPITNYVKASKEDVAWKGIALFDKYKMVGILNSEQSWALMHLRDDAKGGDFALYPEQGNQDKHLVIQPNQIDTSTKLQVINGKVKAHYDVYMQANIIEKNFDTDLSDPENLKKLAKLAEKQMQRETEEVITLLQKKYKVDALKLGVKLKAYHFAAWQKMKWKEDFPKADITVSYRLKFRRTGMEMK